jgi:hypothetical protein
MILENREKYVHDHNDRFFGIHILDICIFFSKYRKLLNVQIWRNMNASSYFKQPSSFAYCLRNYFDDQGVNLENILMTVGEGGESWKLV